MQTHHRCRRLHPTQLAYVLNHAQDRALFVDLSFVPLVEAVCDHLVVIRFGNDANG